MKHIEVHTKLTKNPEPVNIEPDLEMDMAFEEISKEDPNPLFLPTKKDAEWNFFWRRW